MYEIKVPATSANIGPGFDSLGLALNKYNYVNFKKGKEKYKISGNIEKYISEDNLIYKSFRKAEYYFKRKPINIEIDIQSDIPLSRGLGSSASCAVSGVAGAMLIHNIDIDNRIILDIASEIEGHPDNAAPCIYGGLTASFSNKGTIYSEKFKVSQKLKFYALVPEFEMLTKDSRAILPDTVKYTDAVFNLSRVPLLIKGLEKGDINLIKETIQDKLHQPYREKIIKEVDLIKNIFMKNNIAYYLSGAGPTIMGISTQEHLDKILNKEILKLKQKWKILNLNVDNDGFTYRRIN